jgi:hypothetical protein
MEQDGQSLAPTRRGELTLAIHELERRFFGPGAETNGQLTSSASRASGWKGVIT